MSIFSHHAYIVPGNPTERREKLRTLFVEEGIVLENNPDIFELHTDVLSIDEARTLSERQLRHAITGSKKIFIITFSNMSHESQNALLKVFEEPTPDTHFFLLTESPHALLPTLRSRLEELKLDTDETDGRFLKEAKTFITETPSERLLHVVPIIEEKDKNHALALLNALESVLHKEFTTTKEKGIQVFLKDIERLRGYLGDRSPSLKLILEYIACTCPKK